MTGATNDQLSHHPARRSASADGPERAAGTSQRARSDGCRAEAEAETRPRRWRHPETVPVAQCVCRCRAGQARLGGCSGLAGTLSARTAGRHRDGCGLGPEAPDRISRCGRAASTSAASGPWAYRPTEARDAGRRAERLSSSGAAVSTAVVELPTGTAVPLITVPPYRYHSVYLTDIHTHTVCAPVAVHTVCGRESDPLPA
mgnify:CR=1 FL=1